MESSNICHQNTFMRRIVLFITSFLFILGCKDNEPFSCDQNPITIEIVSLSPPTMCDYQDAAVEFAVSGGEGPYDYLLNTGSTIISQKSGLFTSLFPGYLSITVRDNNRCTSTLEFQILNEVPTGISYANDIRPILDAHCNLSGCHNGDLGADRDWTKISAIQAKLNNFQRVLTLRKMPPDPNPKLVIGDVSAILCWIADGGLNN